MDLSTRNLEQALSIRRQIDALERRLRGLVGGAGGGAATAAPRRGGRRRMSAAARAKIAAAARARDRKSTRLNSSHQIISYAVFCEKKKTEAHGWSLRQKRHQWESWPS